MASVRETTPGRSEPITPPQWLMDAAITRIHAGHLPRELLSRVIAGPGRGQLCGLCEHSIETGDVGYEVIREDGPDLPPLHFHLCCYRAWVKACGLMPRSMARRDAGGGEARPDPGRSRG